MIVRPDQGLHFLGHAISDQYVLVDRHTTKRALGRVNMRNLVSYKSLKIVELPKRQLDWIVLNEIDETLH